MDLCISEHRFLNFTIRLCWLGRMTFPVQLRVMPCLWSQNDLGYVVRSCIFVNVDEKRALDERYQRHTATFTWGTCLNQTNRTIRQTAQLIKTATVFR